MEPGLRDREYEVGVYGLFVGAVLQWSPVLETGNTSRCSTGIRSRNAAAMEPGLRDREYPSHSRAGLTERACCNGARS